MLKTVSVETLFHGNPSFLSTAQSPLDFPVLLDQGILCLIIQPGATDKPVQLDFGGCTHPGNTSLVATVGTGDPGIAPMANDKREHPGWCLKHHHVEISKDAVGVRKRALFSWHYLDVLRMTLCWFQCTVFEQDSAVELRTCLVATTHCGRNIHVYFYPERGAYRTGPLRWYWVTLEKSYLSKATSKQCWIAGNMGHRQEMSASHHMCSQSQTMVGEHAGFTSVQKCFSIKQVHFRQL